MVKGAAVGLYVIYRLGGLAVNNSTFESKESAQLQAAGDWVVPDKTFYEGKGIEDEEELKFWASMKDEKLPRTVQPLEATAEPAQQGDMDVTTEIAFDVVEKVVKKEKEKAPEAKVVETGMKTSEKKDNQLAIEQKPKEVEITDKDKKKETLTAPEPKVVEVTKTAKWNKNQSVPEPKVIDIKEKAKPKETQMAPEPKSVEIKVNARTNETQKEPEKRVVEIKEEAKKVPEPNFVEIIEKSKEKLQTKNVNQDKNNTVTTDLQPKKMMEARPNSDKDINDKTKGGQLQPEKETTKTNWMTPESEFVEIPEQAKEDARLCKVWSNSDEVLTINGQTLRTFYRTANVSCPDPAKAKPAGIDLLLLHGNMFTSQTWRDPPLETIQLFSRLGFRVVAVDLPGYGESKKDILKPTPYETFLEAFIKALGLRAPVIVSPSMSGKFSLPYLVKDPANIRARCRGYVPVAPGDTDRYVDQFEDLKVPTLIVYGEWDKKLGVTASTNLQKLPINKVMMIKQASHPAYRDKPDYFHGALYNFLLSVKKMK